MTIFVDVSGVREPAIKGFARGTHRLISPAETVARVRPLLPVMGITRIANVTGLDSVGIPVVTVCRPNARSIAVSQGKGLDLDSARASGLMESIEAYHAETIALPLRLASYEELRYTCDVVDPALLPRPASSRFDPYLPILWIEGFDVIGKAPAWIPYELVHLNFTVAARYGAGHFIASSNGLASGNHLLEAISHGLCEVVERDALARWGLLSDEERAAAAIDLASVVDAGCLLVLERFARAGLAVAVWEITSDIEIPAFLCRIAERDDRPLRRLPFAEGSGCHPARAAALLRALTEAAQSRLTLIAGSRDDCFRADYERWRSLGMLLRPELSAGARPFADGPGWERATFDEDLALELECLRAAGVEQAIVVELTRPELNIPVVRVVVPGLAAPPGSGAAPRLRSPAKQASLL
jgi:ribosomal protein S12 methylthiotransferase accessory factor